ncbi:unnamed protein product [Heligmosomoides polygyrus]|uniref:Uncharacterized protein n=1 Tax=Heligmosomoides polygyrus TaxID=6339 RepID=A0A183GEG5_HELPZ|nr:unnamed protein product [Heligmosomoides polygyrus]
MSKVHVGDGGRRDEHVAALCSFQTASGPTGVCELHVCTRPLLFARTVPRRGTTVFPRRSSVTSAMSTRLRKGVTSRRGIRHDQSNSDLMSAALHLSSASSSTSSTSPSDSRVSNDCSDDHTPPQRYVTQAYHS